MKSMSKFIYLLLATSLLLGACGNLQQDITLEIPEYEPRLVVESYLQPGLPYFLTLTRSQPYFDDLEVSYITDALVTISHSQGTDTLDEININVDDPALGLIADTVLLNTFSTIFGTEITFYGSFNPVPALYDEDFTLQITTPDDEKLSAVTQIPRPVPIDSQVQDFNSDDMALVLTFFTDPGGSVDYYRRVIEDQRVLLDSMGGMTDTTFENRVLQDFVVDDDIFNGRSFAFGTDFMFEEGDSIFSSLYHLTQDHFQFITTRDAAITASLSPFGQPAVVHTNIRGGIGIFTGLTFVTDTLVVKP